MSTIQKLARFAKAFPSSLFTLIIQLGLAALVLLAASMWCFASPATSSENSGKILLHDNWQIQSSCMVKAGGAEISTAGFAPDGWHPASAPTTVVAALVADHTYSDPYFGMNLKSFPGMNYNGKEFFANQDMSPDSPFRCSWWFRTEFAGPADAAARATWLNFDGINYRANVWLNGQQIANSKDVVGMMRRFRFDVSKHLAAGGRNALAVEVFAPEKDALAMTWVDWNPTPPDKDMGLWKDVFLTTTGAVSIQHPFVASKLDAAYKSAGLTITVDLTNSSSQAAPAELQAEIDSIHISQKVELAAGESKTLTLSPEQFPQLKLAHPRLWWPYQMGSPELYKAHLSVEVGGQISDSSDVTFGVREVTSQLTEKGFRLFKINGRKVLIRGAAWAPDMLLRWSPERAQTAIDYVRGMNLNTIRLEGRMERDEFFDMADRAGVFIMPGWTCCDFWEQWKSWTPDTAKVAAASMADQARRLRNHAGVLVWLYGSDNPPPSEYETMYLQVLKDAAWPNPTVSSAADTTTGVTGVSGVKMTGPYEYVPPDYWLVDRDAGGAYGYNTETSPGPEIPTLQSLKKFIPADHLWPVDDYWNYHAGLDRFTTIDRFTNGMTQRYGKAASLDDFLRKSQAMQYEDERAMFEAYARNKYDSTGVIQWMLNNAWPSIIWNLYDYYLVPSGAYFGSRKACEPLHVQYSYDDNSVSVINQHDRAFSGMRVQAAIYDIDLKERSRQTATLDIPADSSVRAIALKPVDGISTTYFLKLELRDSSSKLVSENFYWLSSKPDVIDWAHKVDTVYTPQSAYADLTALNSLPPVKLAIRSSIKQEGKEKVVHAWIENPSSSLAFMVHARVANPKDDDVVPIFWDDNYVSLLPGEIRELSARFESSDPGSNLTLAIDGWNIAATSQPLSPGEKR
ncbi:MAG TPA: beta galactosidase jelly roll domain-containing protein [Terriglobales bacterium]|nr:beta galactosidase jelly roll domain-containing protein [Terriglobales bacterium]